jgi:hypothetical protein
MSDTDTQNTNVGDGGSQGAVDTQQQQTQPLGWKTELPEAQRGHEAFAPYTSKSELYKGHIDLYTKHSEAVQKLTDLEGKLSGYIPKLTENATDEQKAAYREAMGIPNSPDAYELDKPQLPDGLEYNADMEKWYRETAHKLGLPKDTAKALFGEYNGMIQTIARVQIEQAEKVRADGMEKLKTEWKSEYDGNVAIVKRVQEKIGVDPETKQWITDHNAENDPVLVKLLYKIAPAYLDDTVPGTGSINADTRSTEEKAKDFYKT